MRIDISVLVATLLMQSTPRASQAADEARQEAVHTRSSDVMPFEMSATTHVFTKRSTGGVQRVVAKNAADTQQIQLVRGHLKGVASSFGRGDFSGPAHVHGADMPGLAALRAAAPRDLRVAYRDVPDGAEIEYTSDRANIVAALHQWFDAQLADHGTDAMAGHDHTMPHNP